MENLPDLLASLTDPLAIFLVVAGAIAGMVYGLVVPGDDFFGAAMWSKGGVGAALGGVAYIALTTLS